MLFSGLLGGSLYQVSRFDPLTLACVLTALLLIALGAGFVPARRAAAVNTVEALRAE